MLSELNRLLNINRKLPRLLFNTFAGCSTSSRQKQKKEMNENLSTDIVWMDLEMTGLDVIKDKILEVSCLITDKDLNVIVEGPCLAINHPPNSFDEMNDWCKKHHHESGLVEKCINSHITTEKGEQLLLDFLKQHIAQRKCPLAGNSVYMDR